MNKLMQASVLQYRPVFGDRLKNTDKVASLLKKASRSDLVVLPELANTGYNFINRDEALSLAEEPEKSAYVEMLVNHARKNKQLIVSGFHEREDPFLFNTSLLISGNGIEGKYRKVHLFMNEKTIFEPGNLGFPVFQVDDVKIGMLICFDYLFAEAWRIMALKGADVIAHPSNLLTNNAKIVVPAQALMNRIFILTGNRTGTERNLTFNGNSFAVGPDGTFISQLNKTEENVLSVNLDLNLSHDKFITPLNHVFNDRFPDLYKNILD